VLSGGIAGTRPYKFRWKASEVGAATIFSQDSLNTKAKINYVPANGSLTFTNTISNNCSDRYPIIGSCNVNVVCRPSAVHPNISVSPVIDTATRRINFGTTFTFSVNVPPGYTLASGGVWNIFGEPGTGCIPPASSYTVTSSTNSNLVVRFNTGYPCNIFGQQLTLNAFVIRYDGQANFNNPGGPVVQCTAPLIINYTQLVIGQ
jgi:hypothetical protein